ncbi:MAG: tetratricopeptide repeat protein [Eubacterium sp.]|nr:tetratricopeptide repeat protein [Eubacterium sp.]
MNKVVKKTALLFVSAASVLMLALSGCGNPKEKSAALEEGLAAMEEGSYSEAMTSLRGALDVDGDRAQALRAIGVIYYKQGKYTNAIKNLNNALDAADHEKAGSDFVADTAMYLAGAYLKNGDSAKAKKLYDKLLGTGQAGKAYVMKGTILLQEGKISDAEEAFGRAAHFDSGFDIYLQIYDAYNSIDREADGAEYLKTAMQKKPDSEEEYYTAGKIAYLLGDYDTAIEYLGQTEKDYEGAADALLLKCYLEAGDETKASDFFQNWTSDGEHEALGHCGLALLDMDDENYDSALNRISDGLSAAEGTVRAALLYDEIICYEKKGDFGTARGKAAAAASEFPDNKEIERENTFLSSR